MTPHHTLYHTALLLLAAVALCSPLGAQPTSSVPAQMEVRAELQTLMARSLNFGGIFLPVGGTVVTMDYLGKVATNATTFNEDLWHTGLIRVTSTADALARPHIEVASLPMVHAGGSPIVLTLEPRLYGGNSAIPTDGNQTYAIQAGADFELKVAGTVTVPQNAPKGIYNCQVPVTIYWE